VTGVRAARSSRLVPLAAVALILALTGCSRLTGTAGEASTLAPPAAATTSAPAVPDTATLGSISSDLGSAGTADTEAESNATAGDQAAAQDDNG
jgi:hypothetical protein